jgi:hypothetical protein
MRKPKIIALAASGLFAASLLGGCFPSGGEPPDIEIPDQVCELAPQLPGCESIRT